METLSSKPISSDGPPLDQGKQMEIRVGPANLNKRFSTSWRQKISPAARDRESTGVGQPGQGRVQVAAEAVEGAEVTKPSSPHKLRSLVAFMSRRKSGAPRPVSAPPNLPLDSVETGTPQPKLTTSPPVAVSPSAPATVSPSAPAAATPASPQSNVNRACSCAVCTRSLAPGAGQEPAQTTTSPRATAAAPSSTALHPTFAAFLEKAALAEAASVRPAGVNATATNPPRQPAQRCPSTTSSRVSSRLHPDCNNPACVSAIRQIRAVRSLKKEFAKAKIQMDYHSTLKALDGPLSAAYQVLLECEYKSIMARVNRVAVVLKRMEGLPVNNQNVIAQYRTLLRLSGMETSTAPASALTGIGIPQRQSACAGGGLTQAGGYAHTAGYTPAGGYTSMAGRGPTPDLSSLNAWYALLAARYAYPPTAGHPHPAYYASDPAERMLAARGAPTVGYTPTLGHTLAVRSVPAAGAPPAAGHNLGAPGPTPVAANVPAAGAIPVVGPAPAVRYPPAPAGPAPAAGPTPAAGAVAVQARPMSAPVGPMLAVGPTPAIRPPAGAGPGTPAVGNISPAGLGFMPATGSMPMPAAGSTPAAVPAPAAVRLNPAVQPSPTAWPMPVAGPAPATQSTAQTPGPAPGPRLMPVVGNSSTAGPIPAVQVGPTLTAALALAPRLGPNTAAGAAAPAVGHIPQAATGPTPAPAAGSPSPLAAVPALTSSTGPTPGPAARSMPGPAGGVGPMPTASVRCAPGPAPAGNGNGNSLAAVSGPVPSVGPAPMPAVRHIPGTAAGSAPAPGPVAVTGSIAGPGLGPMPAPRAGPQAATGTGTLVGFRVTPAVGPMPSAPQAVRVASTLASAVGPTGSAVPSQVQVQPPASAAAASAPGSTGTPTSPGHMPAIGSMSAASSGSVL
ncbi:hypothetical protein GSI_03512 [Ganoderma sinense ZZ0214-1]|uniref:Uncharacterized protein n=1 Tax=Ganoderma sinense ZZ0214-1 TaxID=1077348 RepID=A0A2G8SLV4_9APHY|nr:hypothetical protein GSI_03512 [Ganoderma sinense ZZ0214-1]